jgi:hypothetical protein
VVGHVFLLLLIILFPPLLPLPLLLLRPPRLAPAGRRLRSAAAAAGAALGAAALAGGGRAVQARRVGVLVSGRCAVGGPLVALPAVAELPVGLWGGVRWRATLWQGRAFCGSIPL